MTRPVPTTGARRCSLASSCGRDCSPWAAAAAVLSFAALRDLAAMGGVAPALAPLPPVTVDAGAARAETVKEPCHAIRSRLSSAPGRVVEVGDVLGGGGAMTRYYLEVRCHIAPVDAVDGHTDAMMDALSVEPNLTPTPHPSAPITWRRRRKQRSAPRRGLDWPQLL